MRFPTMWHFDMNRLRRACEASFSGLENSKCCSVNSLTVIEYLSNKQRLWTDCAYTQAGLTLCWSHIPVLKISCRGSICLCAAFVHIDQMMNMFFVVLVLYIPVDNFLVMLGQFPVFLGWTSTKQQIKCLVQGHNTVTLPVVSLELATLWSPV